MSRTVWLVEHTSRGVYLGQGYAGAGRFVPLFRDADRRRPAMTYPTRLAAETEIARLAPHVAEQADFAAVMLR